MKIGTVMSTCIYDIVTDKVQEDEVLLILDMVGYDFTKQEHLDECWTTMTTDRTAYTSWHDLNKQHVYDVLVRMFNQEKFHQYKHSNIHSPMFWTPWLELIIPNENLNEVPMLKQAWDEYLFLSKLVGK